MNDEKELTSIIKQQDKEIATLKKELKGMKKEIPEEDMIYRAFGCNKTGGTGYEFFEMCVDKTSGVGRIIKTRKVSDVMYLLSIFENACRDQVLKEQRRKITSNKGVKK